MNYAYNHMNGIDPMAVPAASTAKVALVDQILNCTSKAGVIATTAMTASFKNLGSNNNIAANII